MNLRSPTIKLVLKVYVTGVLIMAAVGSPPYLAFVPVLLVAFYLFLWRWPLRPFLSVLADYFIYFTIALLLIPLYGQTISPLIALPVLLLINDSLQESAGFLSCQHTNRASTPTRLNITMLAIAVLVIIVALLTGSQSLILAGAVMLLFLIIMVAVMVWRLPVKPVVEHPVAQRLLVGAETRIDVQLSILSRLAGKLIIESPYPWLKVVNPVISLTGESVFLRVSLSPPLSGPAVIKLRGYAIDRWGILQTQFELEPINLHVIPRARYAEWLIRQYMAGTKPGMVPLTSDIMRKGSVYGLKRGGEYYGSQLYQSGDSLKNIDWKRSIKYNELIAKEFTQAYVQSAILLINLAARDADDADKLAHKIMTTALSLARENVPTALVAYDDKEVRVTTLNLPPRQLLLKALEIVPKIIIIGKSIKYLKPPDVRRLRADMRHLQAVDGEASQKLRQLLQVEYDNLSRIARGNPATAALAVAFKTADRQANILVISQRNHDAEALAFNSFELARRGAAVFEV